MLNKEFRKIAKKVRRKWATPAAMPHVMWNKGYNFDKPVFKTTDCSTHCGTVELRDVDSDDRRQGATLERIVANLAWRATRDAIGNFVYYCPQTKTYAKATAKLKKLGFDKLKEFHHLGNLDREEDKGVAELWSLSFTPDEVRELVKLGGVKVDPILLMGWPDVDISAT